MRSAPLSNDQLIKGLLSTAHHLLSANPNFDADKMLAQAIPYATDLNSLYHLSSGALDLSCAKVYEAAHSALSHAKLASQAKQRDDKVIRLENRAARTIHLIDDTHSGTHRQGFTPISGRIAYVAYSSLPYQTSGYANRTQFLVRGLRQAGLDVHCVTRPGFPWDEQPTSRTHLPPRTDHTGEIDGVPYHRIKSPEFSSWDNHASYLRAATDALTSKFLKLRPELVIGASNHACALPALLAARRLNLAFVNEVRGFWEDSRAARERSFDRSPQYRLEHYLDTEVARRADMVVTLSAIMRDELVARRVPLERIKILPNGFQPHQNILRTRPLSLPNDVPVIGYVGSFAPYEGLDILIEACATLRMSGFRFRLLLVGDDKGIGRTGDVRGALMDQAKQSGLEDWLIAPGRVPPNKVPDYLDLIDIAAFPRRKTRVTDIVSPLKPLEAMAAGHAIVASDLAGIGAYLVHKETCLRVTPDSPVDLSIALARLIVDKSLRQTLGEAARRLVHGAYAWDEIALQFAADLTPLMTGGADGPHP